MIVFGNPKLLVPILLIIALVIIAYLKNSKTYIVPLEIYNGSRLKKPSFLLSIMYYSGCILIIIGWLLIGAVSLDPARITHESKLINTSSIVLYLIDVSPSMAASDIAPTRFARASDLIEASAKSTNALHGLIAYGKDAALVCPPTAQTEIFLERLQTLKPGLFGDGTNILSAIKSAILQISGAKLTDAVIVLLSDGEDYESLGQLAMFFETSTVNTKIYFAALGKGGDVPITYTDPFTEEATSGMYRSQFNEEKLKAFAESANIVFSVNPEMLEISLQNHNVQDRSSEAVTRSGIKLLFLAVLFLLFGFLIVFGIFGGTA